MYCPNPFFNYVLWGYVKVLPRLTVFLFVAKFYVCCICQWVIVIWSRDINKKHKQYKKYILYQNQQAFSLNNMSKQIFYSLFSVGVALSEFRSVFYHQQLVK